MKHITYTALCGVLLLLCSCTNVVDSTDITDSIRQAEQAIAQGDMQAAQSAGDYLMKDDISSGLSATQLARLSMVYVQLADSLDQQENLRKAADLYDMALRANADSANHFYNNLSPDQLQYYAAMTELSQRRSTPISLDSIPDEEEAIHFQHDTIL